MGGDGTFAADLQSRIAKSGAPFSRGSTNYWIEAEADLQRLPVAVGLAGVFEGWPRISLTVIGDGQNLVNRGELQFSKPLGLRLEPWAIPTNLVQSPLVSFSAARSVAPLLRFIPFLAAAQPEETPNQAYAWGLANSPFGVFFAFPG